MVDWRSFRKRKRVKVGAFDPNSAFISQALRGFLAEGGRITVLTPQANVRQFDFNIEDEALESLNSRGVYD